MFDKTAAVILCGGRGERMGILTENTPKPLIKVQGKPIIWYIFHFLYSQGFKNFIFPVGYKNDLMTSYINKYLKKEDVNILIRFTGEETSISRRLYMVQPDISNYKDFLLVNGDTIFNFDVHTMYQQFVNQKLSILLSYMPVQSKYGLIIEKENQIIGFERDTTVDKFINESTNIAGYINSGITFIQSDALNEVNLNTDADFEENLYCFYIDKNKLGKYKINGSWYAFDTQKDIKSVNANSEQKIVIDIKKIKDSLLGSFPEDDLKQGIEARYAYRTRYIQNEAKLLEQIKNKTIIPHQVEVQPGRESSGKLCWLECPYCYGGTAENVGDRLSLERYKEVLNQTAKGPHGGVDKIIFAGYATDPLNYQHINELFEVALKNNQVTGFHTKNIKISEKFIDNLTSNTIREKSYFSISVDAGTNYTYNVVHGMKNTNAKLYDKVYENTKKITMARDKNKSPLDISVTYLITEHNKSTSEIIKFIEDYKSLGVDLIRFTFPQVPRGMDKADNEFVLSRQNILKTYKDLVPIIEPYSDVQTKVLILDLDSEYTITSDRVLPCFARYIFPSIGFDGQLYHCSESSAPHFHDISLGNLQNTDFWELFYNYDVTNFLDSKNKTHSLMNKLDCRCDRKEHAVNSIIKDML